MEVKSKRKDLLLLLLSVFLLGVEISLIANIIFDRYYENNSKLFILIILFTLLINLAILIYVVTLSEVTTKSVELYFVYDQDKKIFVDIPFSPSSVNARVLYNNLSDKKKESIYIKDEPYATIESYKKNIREKSLNFYNFCNSAVVHLIFSRFLKNHIDNVNIKTVDIEYEYFKELLCEFKYIDVDNIIGRESEYTQVVPSNLVNISKGIKVDKVIVTIKPVSLSLPEGFKIKSVNKNSIKLESKYGYVIFEWKVLRKSIGNKIKLLSTYKNINLNNSEEIKVDLKMKYGFKITKLFKSSTIEFEEFINNCYSNMSKFDISTSLEKLKIENSIKITQFLNKSLSTNHEFIEDIAQSVED